MPFLCISSLSVILSMTLTFHHDNSIFRFLEDFVPEKWLGRGGYGVVFNCRNRLDDRSYAVKRIAVSNTSVYHYYHHNVVL